MTEETLHSRRWERKHPVRGSAPSIQPGLLRHIVKTSWRHQLALVGLTVSVFLLEVVPLELQRRILNNLVKHRPFSTIILLGGTYLGAVMTQGGIKLGLNVYRSWVGERAKRDLRERIRRWTRTPSSLPQPVDTQGTVVAMMVSEVEPVGNFIGASVSEPLLQAGILATVISYIFHLDVWMGAAALAIFLPQLIFVPLMQRAMNRRTRGRVSLLRRIGAGTLRANGDPLSATRQIERVFRLNMAIFELKFTLNFLMNLCSHLQVITALLLGGWWVLHDQLEIGGVVAFISGLGRLNDPWGDLVNYLRDLSVNAVKYNLITDACHDAATVRNTVPAGKDPATAAARS
ncbi:MAG: ABC transporter ATP-binding protein [Alphaproteobacteria bacterium]|nr:ABC transporter ATP-binding protein [Alphaproteobacteria bacterium]